MKRRCLKCDREFVSKGKANRLCFKCNSANRNLKYFGNYVTTKGARDDSDRKDR